VSQTLELMLRRGRLYLPAELYERYFAGLESVVLIRRDDDLVVLPVRHAGAGGYLLKRRDAAGERVTDAVDFLRAQGIDEEAERTFGVVWDSAVAGLLIRGFFSILQT